MKRGALPDLDAAARIVLHDWNTGKIPFYTRPPIRAKDHIYSSVVQSWGKEFDIDQYDELLSNRAIEEDATTTMDNPMFDDASTNNERISTADGTHIIDLHHIKPHRKESSKRDKESDQETDDQAKELNPQLNQDIKKALKAERKKQRRINAAHDDSLMNLEDLEATDDSYALPTEDDMMQTL
jgi:hypothetical protein